MPWTRYCIACQEKAAPGLVPDGEGKHAAELGEHGGAVELVEVEQNFGVAVGAEAPAFSLQFCAQFAVIVDLTVRDQRRGTGEQRLIPALAGSPRPRGS